MGKWWSDSGSSPRMRGTLPASAAWLPSGRIIPAYAGNTPGPGSGAVRTADHPRVCGEHIFSLQIDQSGPGSSPRMRGTRYRAIYFYSNIRIIPAYAGNTIAVFHGYLICSDHPRVCGEHIESGIRFWGVSGSSPRMRGTRDYHLFQ